MRLARWIALGWLAVSLPCANGAAQDGGGPDEQDEAYRALIHDAVEQSRSGHLQEALALFTRAHELRPSARTLRGIGLVRFGLSDYAGTIRALEASLADERRPLGDEDRAEAQEVLERARAFVAWVELTVEPPDATLTVDGRPLSPRDDGTIALNPGRHELRFEAPARRPEVRTLTLEGGARQTLEVTLRPEVEPTPAPVEAEASFEIRVSSEPPGLLLHAAPLSDDGAPIPHAVTEVCISPCEARLDRGLYRLGIGRRAQEPTFVEDYRVDEALSVTMHFEDREDARIAGWILGGSSLGAALVVLATVAALSTDTARIVLGVIAAGVGAGGLAVGIPLVAWNDSAAVDVLPLAEPE